MFGYLLIISFCLLQEILCCNLLNNILDCSNSKLEDCPNYEKKYETITTLNLHGNLLRNFISENCSKFLNVQTIDLSDNKIDNPEFINVSTTTLILSKNKLKSINLKPGIQYLDLSFNPFDQSSVSKLLIFLEKDESITHLDLSNINLNQYISMSFRPTELTYFSLAGNQLKEVYFDSQFFFVPRSGDNTLNLSGNQLSKLNLNHAKPKLNILDLSNNKLANFADISLDLFTDLKKINLMGNPITCDCKINFHLAEWLERKADLLLNSSSTLCSDQKTKILSFNCRNTSSTTSPRSTTSTKSSTTSTKLSTTSTKSSITSTKSSATFTKSSETSTTSTHKYSSTTSTNNLPKANLTWLYSILGIFIVFVLIVCGMYCYRRRSRSSLGYLRLRNRNTEDPWFSQATGLFSNCFQMRSTHNIDTTDNNNYGSVEPSVNTTEHSHSQIQPNQCSIVCKPSEISLIKTVVCRDLPQINWNFLDSSLTNKQDIIGCVLVVLIKEDSASNIILNENLRYLLTHKQQTDINIRVLVCKQLANQLHSIKFTHKIIKQWWLNFIDNHRDCINIIDTTTNFHEQINCWYSYIV